MFLKNLRLNQPTNKKLRDYEKIAYITKILMIYV